MTHTPKLRPWELADLRDLCVDARTVLRATWPDNGRALGAPVVLEFEEDTNELSDQAALAAPVAPLAASERLARTGTPVFGESAPWKRGRNDR